MTTPAFRIVADGDDVTRAVADRLVSLRITDEAGQTSDSLEITLDDRASQVPVPRSGAWLKVWLGYSTGGRLPVYMGAFAVDDVDVSGGPRSMVIKATAAQTAPELVKGQRTQSWHNKTLGEVAQEIGKRNGLQVVIKGSLASTQIKHEDQTNESDQAFMTRLAEKHKATVKPADGKLVLVPRGEGQAGATITLKPTDVISWRANLKNRGAYGKVSARYLDRTTQKERTVSAGGDAGGLPAFEDRQLYPSEAEAQKAADSRLQSLRAGEVRVSITTPGRPELNAEGLITLQGFRPEVDGTWNVRTVTHDLSGSGGYTSSVEAGTQGDENDGWATGRGANDGLPPSRKASAIGTAASSARGMNTRGGPDGGNNACVYAVNKVLRNAGISPPWGNSNYVPAARSALASGGGTLLSGPEPGAIVIMRDNGSPPYPHIGIVQNDGSIISNSSSRGSFSWVASPASYTSYYGRAPEYWRLR
jgi:phage protein D